MDDQLDQTHESLGISTSILCIVCAFFSPIQPHLEIGYIHSIFWTNHLFSFVCLQWSNFVLFVCSFYPFWWMRNWLFFGHFLCFICLSLSVWCMAMQMVFITPINLCVHDETTNKIDEQTIRTRLDTIYRSLILILIPIPYLCLYV